MARGALLMPPFLFDNNESRAVQGGHSQINLFVFDRHPLSGKTRVTGKEKGISLTIAFSHKMWFYCSALSCIWYFSITEHFLRICTFVLEFRAYLRSLENLSLEYNLQSNCHRRSHERKRSVCLSGASSALSLGQSHLCFCDFKQILGLSGFGKRPNCAVHFYPS